MSTFQRLCHHPSHRGGSTKAVVSGVRVRSERSFASKKHGMFETLFKNYGYFVKDLTVLIKHNLSFEEAHDIKDDPEEDEEQ